MREAGGRQGAAGRINSEAKNQIQAWEAKQKAELDAQQHSDEPGHESEQHPREDPMRGGENATVDDDDVPF